MTQSLVLKNIDIDFAVCVRRILRGRVTQGLLIKESTEVSMTRKNGLQATGDLIFFMWMVLTSGENKEANIVCATR